jgi:hypothetical protein
MEDRKLPPHFQLPGKYESSLRTTRLKDFKASELGGIAGKAALAELPKDVEVDQVFFGYVPFHVKRDRADVQERYSIGQLDAVFS